MDNLIIGGSGQDGLFLAKLLVSRGEKVILTYYKNSPKLKLQHLGLEDMVKIIYLDITDTQQVFKALLYSNPDKIYFFAAQSSVGLSFKNEDWTKMVIETGFENYVKALKVLDRNTRTIFCASSECFGINDTKINSKTKFMPLSPYAKSKVKMAEGIISERDNYGFDFRIAYLFNHESEFRTENYLFGKVGKYICDLKSSRIPSDQKLHLGTLDLIRDFGLSSEYVFGLDLLGNLDECTDSVIATGVSISLITGVKKMFESAGLEMKSHVNIASIDKRRSDVHANWADISELKDKLDWIPLINGVKVFDELMLSFDNFYNFKQKKRI
jgi:GDPmannose 4,6-dehydratase